MTPETFLARFGRCLAAFSFALLLSIAPACDDAGGSSVDNNTNGGSNPGSNNESLYGRFDGDTREDGDCVWVEPYYRSDGTCVRGHWRSASGQECSLVGSAYKPCE